MRLTTFTDYALRVLIYVAVHPQARATIAETARAFGVSEHHLTKVVQLLGRAGFLDNVRGRGGGYALARPASAIGVGAVVRATEQAVPAECFAPDTNRCVVTPACRLKGVLGEAVAAFYATLDRYTLADLVADRRAVVRLLFPAPKGRPRPAA